MLIPARFSLLPCIKGINITIPKLSILFMCFYFRLLLLLYIYSLQQTHHSSCSRRVGCVTLAFMQNYVDWAVNQIGQLQNLRLCCRLPEVPSFAHFVHSSCGWLFELWEPLIQGKLANFGRRVCYLQDKTELHQGYSFTSANDNSWKSWFTMYTNLYLFYLRLLIFCLPVWHQLKKAQIK